MYPSAHTADFVAGAAGFTYTWNPGVGQIDNIATLTGLTVTMIVTNISVSPIYRATFTMTVSSDGTTASYTTGVGDFPAAGQYNVAFKVTNAGGTIVLETQPVTRYVSAAL